MAYALICTISTLIDKNEYLVYIYLVLVGVHAIEEESIWSPDLRINSVIISFSWLIQFSYSYLYVNLNLGHCLL